MIWQIHYNIIQGEVKAIIVSQKEYEIDEYGGEITVEVKVILHFMLPKKILIKPIG